MESAPRKVRIVHAVMAKVISVKEKKDEPDREWVHFEGSRESLLMLKDHFKVGDNVKITFDNLTRNNAPS